MAAMSIFKVFGRSPVRGLQQHMEVAFSCVKKLKPFFEAVVAEDWKLAEKTRKEIAKLENEADDLKRDVRVHLPKSFFMPVSRVDILEIVTSQDKLANKTKDIAGMVVGRKMIMPATIKDIYFDFIDISINAAKQANQAIRELNDVLEAGFSGREISLINEMIDKLLKIERDSDKLQIKLRHLIFDMEAKLPAVEVIFLYKIIEWTGDIADHAQHVGDKLQILIAR